MLGVSRATATYLLLDTVTQAGWSIAFVAGGRGIAATARRRDLVVEVEAETITDVALPLAELVSRRNRQQAPHPCPNGDRCALNRGAVSCFHCGRNWPPDETWDRPGESR